MPTSMLQGLNQQATQEELLATIGHLLMAMLEKMPRLDTNDRIILGSVETSQQVSLVANQTLGDIGAIGGRNSGIAMFALSNMGVSNLYNNIVVS